MREITALFVDDDPMILHAIERSLRHAAVCAYFTDHPTEALRLVEEHDVEMIVVDQLMPKLRGVELLREVAARHPSVVRVILSAAGDETDIEAAVQDGLAHRYIAKPWDPHRFVETLIHAYEAVRHTAANQTPRRPAA